VVFFRGQLLEMMQRAAQHCQNLPGDGETFNDEQVRDRFFRSVLIAGAHWSARIYSNRLSLEGELDAARLRTLGAFRKGSKTQAKRYTQQSRSAAAGFCFPIICRARCEISRTASRRLLD
jgi:hypothetical protein